MKCPQCGQWNKASLPRCFRCGTALPKEPEYLGNVPSDWQYEVEKNQQKQNIYIEVDDQGKQTVLSDQRESLAEEMSAFKERKRRGEKEQKRLRAQSIEKGFAPSSRTLRRNIDRENFFSINDNPQTSLRPRPDALVEAPMSTDSYRAITAEVDALSSPPLNALPPLKANPVEDLFATTTILEDTQQLYDGFDDTFAYEPLWQDAQRKGNYSATSTFTGKKVPTARMGFRKILRISLVALLVAVAALTIYSAFVIFTERKAEQQAASAPIVTASMLNEQPAHTIRIPGVEGTEIFVRERKTAYPVIDGVATIEIPDYIWFENDTPPLPIQKEVSLTPYKKLANGDLSPLDPVNFTVEIPLSQIEILTPESNYVEVSKSLYTIKIKVDPGSKLFINDEDISDLVDKEQGIASHNATVQPTGENKFVIRVQSEHARENTVELILYRAYQEIPLDVSVTLPDRTTKQTVEIAATTLTGATVNVLSPHSELDVTKLGVDGTFSFNAFFDKYGKNTITITADFPNKKQSVVNYDIVYVPTPEVYTKTAWGMNEANYSNFLANTANHVNNRRIYECVGTITEFVSERPQLAILNVGTDEKPLNILVENGTQTLWEIGTTYRLYADAYGMYGEIPRLTARYTYAPREAK